MTMSFDVNVERGESGANCKRGDFRRNVFGAAMCFHAPKREGGS